MGQGWRAAEPGCSLGPLRGRGQLVARSGSLRSLLIPGSKAWAGAVGLPAPGVPCHSAFLLGPCWITGFLHGGQAPQTPSLAPKSPAHPTAFLPGSGDHPANALNDGTGTKDRLVIRFSPGQAKGGWGVLRGEASSVLGPQSIAWPGPAPGPAEAPTQVKGSCVLPRGS